MQLMEVTGHDVDGDDMVDDRSIISNEEGEDGDGDEGLNN